jgi:hypothetical protein
MKVTVMDLLIGERKLPRRLLLCASPGMGPSVEVLPFVCDIKTEKGVCTTELKIPSQ